MTFLVSFCRASCQLIAPPTCFIKREKSTLLENIWSLSENKFQWKTFKFLILTLYSPPLFFATWNFSGEALALLAFKFFFCIFIYLAPYFWDEVFLCCPGRPEMPGLQGPSFLTHPVYSEIFNYLKVVKYCKYFFLTIAFSCVCWESKWLTPRSKSPLL